MATTRAMWKGYLKLALVTCPVALYAGVASGQRVSFNQLNKKTGNRLRQQLVDEVTREAVEGENKVRGYEYAKGEYLLVEDEELEAIKIESNKTIEIESFVPRDQIDERFLDSKYYLTPSDKVGQEAFAVIREAMRVKGMVALARIVMRSGGREYPMMIEPWGKGLVATTLHYSYEIKDTSDFFDDIPDVKIDTDTLKLAKQILESKSADFDPSKFVDRYEEAVVKMLQQKQAGIPVAKGKATEAKRSSVNLMEALKGSIAAEPKKRRAS